ncbi:putative inactive lipase [Xenorhabdus stockiae]|uniref:Putative inactive lipase n=1 Tax=Xenorhabdus stockiae TaxID=351614 RepID=A0A2D0KPT8_9GAMM|nr:lipase family protein [Xenorhabdus stockiae]PHM65444.1 putative inactive lipase [Xenorhabdus stockiae]
MTAISSWNNRLINILFFVLTINPVLAFAGAPISTGERNLPTFYNWSGKTPEQAGQLLRVEPLDSVQSLSNADQNIRILYSSTDGIDNHSPITVSGALFLPKGTPPKGGWPLLAWAHGTVGIANICAPSFAGRSKRDIGYLNYWLKQGYAIVATDYQGLGTPGLHPYSDYRATAYSLLDSIRAVQQGHFHLSKKTILIGQSQGGGATFAATLYAKSYSPDLDIVGAVTTGTSVPDAIKKIVKRDDIVRHTLAYLLLAINTVSLVEPSLSPEDYLSDKAIPAFRLSQTHCLRDIEKQIFSDNLTGANSFKKDPSPLIQAIMDIRYYPAIKTDIPIFWGTGGQDVDSPKAGQVQLVTAACKRGSHIEWHLYPDLSHSATMKGSLPDSTIFVKRAFSGEHIDGNCATSTE